MTTTSNFLLAAAIALAVFFPVRQFLVWAVTWVFKIRAKRKVREVLKEMSPEELMAKVSIITGVSDHRKDLIKDLIREIQQENK